MSPQQGGVALLWEEGHQDFKVEAVNIISLNLLAFQLVTVEDRYFVMGGYTPPPPTQQGWMTLVLPGPLAPPTETVAVRGFQHQLSNPANRAGGDHCGFPQ